MGYLKGTFVLHYFALPIALLLTVFAVAAFMRGFIYTLRLIKQGASGTKRTNQPTARFYNLVKEVLTHFRFTPGHNWVALAHWLVLFSFPLLFGTLVTAYGQLVSPTWALPIIGHFFLFEWAIEILSLFGLGAILALTIRRTYIKRTHHNKLLTKKSRFFGSSNWQARFVEWVIIIVLFCVFALRICEFALLIKQQSSFATIWHFPISGLFAPVLSALSPLVLAWIITVLAAIKITVSIIWLLVVGLVPAMGVAWHRFFAFANIYIKRNADGSAALGSLEPLLVAGKPFVLEDLEELDTQTNLGALTLADLSKKSLIDLATCTECGRCQSVCPAWASEGVLSPKILVLSIRDLAYNTKIAEFSQAELLTDEVPSRSTAAIWDCTTCGACVNICPVDIEHVDLIANLRRGQALTQTQFPKDIGRAYKNLEKQANPFGAPARKRLEWTKKCAVPVPVLGKEVESLAEVDCLLWVGCAGAFDEHGQRTTRAVAELLTIAGVKFCVLGDAENCTGDVARRSGNEILYHELARTNIDILNTAGAVRTTKILTSCAHCFNTFAREYPELDGTYTVIHHTQYLNMLVREGRLRPVAPTNTENITYHDPCYLGRHNNEYEQGRNLLRISGGKPIIEMKINRENAFCCGAGGAHAFFETSNNTQISKQRATQAVATKAQTIATACPFCATMLTNGVNSVCNSSTSSTAPTVTTTTPMPLTDDIAATNSSPDNNTISSDNTNMSKPIVKDVAVIMLEAVKRGLSEL